ncbi:MAG: alkaline phosphatase D [Mariniblastus sp.]|jgi:alkaline phosphatase D
MRFVCLMLLAMGACCSTLSAQSNDVGVFQGNAIKIGEVTQHQAIVWTRLTARPDLNWNGIEWPGDTKPSGKSLVAEGKTIDDMAGAIPGTAGSVKLVYWPSKSSGKKETEWFDVDPNADFIHQFKLAGLLPGEKYSLEVLSRSLKGTAGPTVEGHFRTAPAADVAQSVSFTVVTGQDFPRRDDKLKGHKIYPLMGKLDPDFFVHTGDIEYFDKPNPIATNVPMARFKFNRLFGLPNQREFQQATASYFIKDDHDTLKNDCWPGQTYGDLTWDQGLALFKEQFPVGDVPYRTVRWGQDLQIWMVEGRDFRSSNKAPDGPEKTIWGAEQKKWFFETVAASDATFKILISPTPLVGPDRGGKGDNHANKKFEFEGKQLREFIGKQKNMFSCCGDRHWQYVSVDPVSGMREFSCGPTSDKHAGGWSNDKRSPMHQYLNVVGGFLSVTIEKVDGDRPAVAVFRHYSTDGKVLNEDRQVAAE